MDELSNFVFASFDPARRIEVDLASLRFEVLNEVLDHGAELYDEVDRLKEDPAAKNEVHRPGGRRQGLKVAAPW